MKPHCAFSRMPLVTIEPYFCMLDIMPMSQHREKKSCLQKSPFIYQLFNTIQVFKLIKDLTLFQMCKESR